MVMRLVAIVLLTLAMCDARAGSTTPPHVQLLTVDSSVKLEVIDWGGSGRPVILLAGLGDTAHVFDRFAPKLAAWYHVYGITRRGFGTSSAPATGYGADRLGDDVMRVMDALKIDRPVLIGHSIAGEELSDVGSRAPQKIAGLVYLDAGYGYAFYDKPKDVDVPSIPPDIDFYLDVDDMQRALRQLLYTADIPRRIDLFNEAAGALVQIRGDLQAEKSDGPTGVQSIAQMTSDPIYAAILAGMSKFTRVGAPILAIYADPHSNAPVRENTLGNIAEARASDKASVEMQIAALERYNPSARVIRLPNAIHYLFRSNESEILKDVHAFVDSLPTSQVSR